MGPQKKPKIFLEAVLMAIVGLMFALVANQVSPRGISLSTDLFRSSTSRADSKPPPGPATNPNTLAAELEAKGLHYADSNLVFTLHQDPRYAMELVVFIDARDDKHYQEGHIPGAYQMDHYYLEKYLPAVLPICQTADQIVFYCNGGDCEDSKLAALDLADQKIPKEKLFVYGGGMTEWSSNGWPVEVGARKSGMLRPQAATATGGVK